jgi:cell division cycle 20-like protein 1 (cofactor of APC complex)
VKFNIWQDPTSMKTPHKGASDRYLPLRKTPGSSRDLYLDSLDSRDDEDAVQKTDRKGWSVVDVYKAEVLGEGRRNCKDTDIQCFINSNLLKFHESEEENKSNRFPSQNCCNYQEESIPSKTKDARKISKVPAKVLDAPQLYDDFYLNLIDWSASNLLSVGLSNSVYIWNAGNSKVLRLVELSENDLVTSTSSSPSSNTLGVGTHSGQVQFWDCVKNKKILCLGSHSGRVGAISWNTNNILASGSRDKSILLRDIRISSDYVNKLTGHKQEVCGLKWSFDQQQLASGGNDNRLNIWGLHSTTPTGSSLKHTAAVKALAWSPHQHGLLVSGGGTADRTIRFWNSVTG